MARQITVEILGDSSKFTAATDKAATSSVELESTWDKLQKSADELSTSMNGLGEKLDKLDKTGEAADAFGNMERVLNGVTDQLTVLGDQFGINLGPMKEYTAAAAQVAGGMEGIIAGGGALVGQVKNIAPALAPAIAGTWAHVSALIAQAAAFIVANAPMLLIIGSIALLAAGVVLLVKNWDDIQPHVQPVIDLFNDKVVPAANAVWEKGLKPVIDFVTNNWKLIGTLILAPFAPIILIATDTFGIRSKMEAAFNAMLDFVRDTWKGVKDFVTKPFDDILEAAKGAFGVKDAIVDAFTAIPGLITSAFSGLGSIIDGLLAPIISSYNAIADKVPGLSKIGGGGSSGGSSQGYDSRTGSGGGADPGQLRGMTEGLAGGGGGGGASSPGGMGMPSSPGYKDPRGVTLTANDILERRAANNGFTGAPPLVVQIHGDVYARDTTEKGLATGDLNFLTGLRSRGMA